MIVYVKYNDGRRREFQLVTKILNEGGKLFAVKEPATEHSTAFVLSLGDKYKLLSNVKLPFSVAQPTVLGASVRFDYIDGVTLDDNVAYAAISGSKDRLLGAITEFYDLVQGIPHRRSEMSEDFVGMFGGDSGECELADIGCLDVTPENIKKTRAGYVHFDYEWTFPFSVPLGYIFARAIVNTYKKYRDYDISGIVSFEAVMTRFRISRKELERMLVWENSFQQYVHGGVPPVAQNVDEFLTSLRAPPSVHTTATINVLLDELRASNERLRSEVALIADSRVWKVRNFIARMCGVKVIR